MRAQGRSIVENFRAGRGGESPPIFDRVGGIRKAAQSSIAPNIDGEFREMPGQAPERSKEVTDETFPG
jgi:hypothetical protein